MHVISRTMLDLHFVVMFAGTQKSVLHTIVFIDVALSYKYHVA